MLELSILILGHFVITINKSRFLNFFFQLVTSGVSSYQHTSVTLEFFETVVRYEKFFTVEPQHIPCVLVSMHFTLDLCYFFPCFSANEQIVFYFSIFYNFFQSQRFSRTLEHTETNASSIKKNKLVSNQPPKTTLQGAYLCVV